MSELANESSFLFQFDARQSLADPEIRRTLSEPKSRAVIEALALRLGAEPLTAQRFQTLADEVRRQTGAKGRELYHPMRLALTGAASGPELVKLLPVIEEGSRLPLKNRIASCAVRVRALLSESQGHPG